MIPPDTIALRKLPGVGSYTASAVRVFAFNQSDTLIETNIRTALIHHFYSSVLQKTAITDDKLLPIAAEVAEGQDSRTWHWALMDYGAHLKASGVRLNARSAHYTKQSKFEGSLRQVRGTILRVLGDVRKTTKQMHSLVLANRELINEALHGLMRDGLIEKRDGKWSIS